MAEQILSLLLYLILILTAFWFISPQKKPRSHPAYHLACLLEDAPESSLKGQF
jgi:preprotein translocase subunit YajC